MLICSKCGNQPGPRKADRACRCSGQLGHIDDDILKALTPFSPAPVPPTPFQQMVMGAVLGSAFLAFSRR